MGFRGPWADLRAGIEKIAKLSSERFKEQALREFGDVVFGEAVKGWREGTSPYDEAWIGSKGRRLGLYQTGELFNSMRLERYPFGFRIRVGGPVFGRHSLATILEYGGRILSGRTREYAIRAERARKAAVRAGVMSWLQVSEYSRKRTERAMARSQSVPMTFQIPGGGWRTAAGVVIHSTPMLPKRTNELPPRWERAVDQYLDRLTKRWTTG